MWWSDLRSVFFSFIWGLDRRFSASLWSASRSSLSHAKTSVIDRSLNRSCSGSPAMMVVSTSNGRISNPCACALGVLCNGASFDSGNVL